MSRQGEVAIRLPFFYGWVIVVISAFIWTLAVGLFNMGGVFLLPIATELGWARGTVSGAFFLSTLLAGVLAIVAGALTDRIGPRVVVLAGGFLVALGFSLLSRLQALWQLYLFWGLLGLAHATFLTPAAATVSRWFNRRRGLALGITTSGAGMGALVMPPLATFFINKTDWRTAFLFLALLMGLAATVLALGLKRRPEDVGLHPYGVEETAPLATAPKQDSSFSQALRTRALWKVMLACALSAMAYGTITVHLIPYAIDAGISSMAAATLISARGMGGLMSRMGWGAVEDRLGSRRTASFCFFLSALPFLFIPFTSHYTLLFLLAAFVGFAQGGFSVSRYGLLEEMFGTASIGAIMGITEAGTLSGWGLGAVLGGFTFDLTENYYFAFLSSALSLFLAVGIVLTLKPSRREGEQE